MASVKLSALVAIAAASISATDILPITDADNVTPVTLKISMAQMRTAVLEGAVHRLRPKFLTEATAIVGLAPMLWSTGVGAEVIAPMAAPVLGGLLIADEVIDIYFTNFVMQ